MMRSLLMGGLLLAATACSDKEEEDSGGGGSGGGDALAGAELYSTTCAGCHGVDGVGNGGANSIDLNSEIPSYGGDEAALADQIVAPAAPEAGSATMPAGLVTEEEATDVAAYLISQFGS
jgi:mono/diheme cytochrome c family protein